MGIGRCFSKHFGSGRATMRPCAVRLKYLFAPPPRSATGCVGSRNVPADPFCGQGILSNCVWHSKYTAVSCSRNPLTLRTSRKTDASRRTERSAMTRLLERAWVPLVMVIVVAIAAFTVTRLHGIFGSHMYTPDVGNSDAIVQFNPKRVLYEIFGPAGTAADINYLDADAQPQRVDAVTLPWSLELVTTLTAVAANVVAQGDSDTIGCRITVNGDVR